PEPGDLIEIDRTLHQHWALYVGDGYVIHLTPVGKAGAAWQVHKVTVFTRKVKKQLLKEVVGKDKWSPNNKSDKYYTPLPVEEIIQRAEGYIGKEVTYRVFGSNCENFGKKLRYGDQVSD
ncbi:PA216 protein, partial [Pachycephala philippinensis]|nr:PA216 protein [Pachycephala philippinensis]